MSQRTLDRLRGVSVICHQFHPWVILRLHLINHAREILHDELSLENATNLLLDGEARLRPASTDIHQEWAVGILLDILLERHEWEHALNGLIDHRHCRIPDLPTFLIRIFLKNLMICLAEMLFTKRVHTRGLETVKDITWLVRLQVVREMYPAAHYLEVENQVGPKVFRSESAGEVIMRIRVLLRLDKNAVVDCNTVGAVNDGAGDVGNMRKSVGVNGSAVRWGGVVSLGPENNVHGAG